MGNQQQTTPKSTPLQNENISAIIANESSKELQKKFVVALLSIVGFTAFVPKGAAGLAETFGLDLGLAFRMFAALYFSLPMLLIILWHIDLVMKEQSQDTQDKNPGNNNSYYTHWFKIRMPLLLIIISIYLGFIIVLPFFAHEIITTIATVVAGITIYYLYIKFVAHGKNYLLFHVPFLIMNIVLLASIGLYAVPWSKLMHRIAIAAIMIGVLWFIIEFIRFSKIPSEKKAPENKFRPGGRNSLLAGGFALCIIAIILWYPSELMRPQSYQNSDTAVFNIALLNTDHSQYFNKIITPAVNTASIGDTAKKNVITDSDVGSGKTVPFMQNALRFVQWRGIALLLIPMIALVLYRYQCRRYGSRKLIGGETFLTQAQKDKRVQTVDAWLITLAIMLLMLFEPASDPAKNKNIDSKKDQYEAIINAPQWYLPGILMHWLSNKSYNNNTPKNVEINFASVETKLDKLISAIDQTRESLNSFKIESKQQNDLLLARITSVVYSTAAIGINGNSSRDDLKSNSIVNSILKNERR